jgi:hypothetical protein
LSYFFYSTFNVCTALSIIGEVFFKIYCLLKILKILRVLTRREWQRVQALENPKPSDQLNGEQLQDDYYFRMCSIYCGMTREEYGNLPSAETQLAIEAANHKTIHPLQISKRYHEGEIVTL